MQFSHKIAVLMRERGLSTRTLGAAVEVSNGTVAGWLKAAKPRPDAAKRLADYFGLSIDTLLDDAIDLPLALREEDQQQYLAEAPLKAAADLARQQHGATPAGQAAFEIYLVILRDLRAEAEQLAKGNADEAVRIFDGMLATWLSLQDGSQGSSWSAPAAAKILARLKLEAGGLLGSPRPRSHRHG